MIPSLLHLVGLRPRVSYALINFRGEVAGVMHPLNTPMNFHALYMYHTITRNTNLKLSDGNSA